MTDVKRPDSLASTLAEVARVGGNVRERLSADMMSLIGQLRDSIQVEPGTQFLEYPAMLTLVWNCFPHSPGWSAKTSTADWDGCS